MRVQSFAARGQQRPARLPGNGQFVMGLLIASLSLGCGTGADDEPSAEDATMCRELGGGLVYIRYDIADEATEVRIQPGLDHDRAQSSPGLSQQALQVLEARGWDEEALEELHGDGALSPETVARLEAMPSCLEALRERSDGGSGLSTGS
jgi:hypothetical protein